MLVLYTKCTVLSLFMLFVYCTNEIKFKPSNKTKIMFQGQLTPQYVVESGCNSNLSEIFQSFDVFVNKLFHYENMPI